MNDSNGTAQETHPHDEANGNGDGGQRTAKAKAERAAADEARRTLSVELPKLLADSQQLTVDDRTDLLNSIEALAAKVSPINRQVAQELVGKLLDLGDTDARYVATTVTKLTGIPAGRRNRVREILRSVLQLHGGNADHDRVLVAGVQYARQIYGTKGRR